MNRRLERTLSIILSLFVMIVFLLTLISNKLGIWLISYIRYATFLVARIFMLIYSLHVLLQKDSFTFSIITAIITAMGFGILSIPAMIMLGRFIPIIMTSGLTYNNRFLDNNTQAIIYTILIVLYFAHLFNAIKLGFYNKKIKEKEENIVKEEEYNLIEDENYFDNEEYIDNKDDIVIESDDNEVIYVDHDDDEDYKVEEVVKVEDLDHEIDFKEGEN